MTKLSRQNTVNNEQHAYHVASLARERHVCVSLDASTSSHSRQSRRQSQSKHRTVSDLAKSNTSITNKASQPCKTYSWNVNFVLMPRLSWFPAAFHEEHRLKHEMATN